MFQPFLKVAPYTVNAASVNNAPVRQIPDHPPFSHAKSPIADPSEVPTKLTVIYTVFNRFLAAGINAYTLL
jgi:hypothetical protein